MKNTRTSALAFQPDLFDPLVAMPAELIDHRLHQAKQCQSIFFEGRPYLFHLLAHDTKLDRRTIWKYLFPYRSISTCCLTPKQTIEQLYEELLSSLESWFSVDPLSPANFTLWNISVTISLMRNISPDFEAKSIFIHLATQDIKNLFQKSTANQLQLLVCRLMVQSGDDCPKAKQGGT